MRDQRVGVYVCLSVVLLPRPLVSRLGLFEILLSSVRRVYLYSIRSVQLLSIVARSSIPCAAQLFLEDLATLHMLGSALAARCSRALPTELRCCCASCACA